MDSKQAHQISMRVSMRRHILSRVNVVASEATRSDNAPFALRFYPHSV